MKPALVIAAAAALLAGARALAQAPPVPPPPHANDPRCHLWPSTGLICRGDPVGVRLCPGGAQLVWSNGHTSPAPRDGRGGYRIGVLRQPGRPCPDGSPPIPTAAPMDAVAGQGPS